MTRAKKQDGPNKRFSVQGWDASHYQKTEAYVAVIDKLYNEAIAEFARLAMRTNIDPDKPFFFCRLSFNFSNGPKHHQWPCFKYASGN